MDKLTQNIKFKIVIYQCNNLLLPERGRLDCIFSFVFLTGLQDYRIDRIFK
ncbi:MAG: hypothetical protein LBE18_11200 [Planctomycetaceae bacterium]|nr:hypothetical protein [Planctomycetaceae bacterium]